MKLFDYPNAPLNMPALEALDRMTGIVPPEDIQQRILAAPYYDDLSGLRLMGNQFVEPDQWRGTLQPKQEIADYVESCGIKVPKRYPTLEEALYVAKHGGVVILRSEHPQEYDGYSGLLESYVIGDKVFGKDYDDFIKLLGDGLTQDGILEAIIRKNTNDRHLQQYLAITGQNGNDFAKDISYSYWEFVKGQNVTVVADDAITGRYHMTAIGEKKVGGGIFNASGEPFSGSDKDIDTLTKSIAPEKIADFIAFYEAIRSLPSFTQQQCPIMEMQLDDAGDIYFLQYHKSRPFRPINDQLDHKLYPTQEGWIKAQAVRGALGSCVTLQTALWYPCTPGYTPGSTEEASFDLHYNIGLSEALSRNRVAFVRAADAKRQYQDMADGAHELRSRWFKPFAGLAIGSGANDALIPSDLHEELWDQVHRQNKMGRIALDYASDGLYGYVRLNPDSKQPIIGNS